MDLKKFFAPTKMKIGVFAGIVVLQILAAGVGLACGWAVVHGTDLVLCSSILAVAAVLIFPSVLVSTIWISPWLPTLPGMLYTALSIILNGLWGWFLTCVVVWLWQRQKRTR